MTDFRMPSFGADMEGGTLVEWLVKPGDKVKRGDIVAVVETQKGAIEIEIFSPGVVSEIVVPVGETVPVGTVLARLDSGDLAEPRAPPPPPPTAAAPPKESSVPPPTRPSPIIARPEPVAQPPAAPTPATPPPLPASRPASRPRISPAARRAAEQAGIDVAALRGTGISGAITLADLAGPTPPPAVPPPPEPPPAAPVPARRTGFDPAAMRQAIAAAMSRSKREIPHYYLAQTVEVAAALARLEQMNQGRAPSERLLPAVLFLRATALALKKYPELNGYWEDGKFRPGEAINVGWAIALRGGGLVAPAIRDADQHSLDELMVAMRDLVQRARGARLRGSELTDPTITVTSLGDRGAESVLPIIQPPQVAMVGVGRIVTRPWVIDNAIGPRPVIGLTLAGDHRASDGHRGGLRLAEIERLLQEPENL